MKRTCAGCGKYMGTTPPYGGMNHEWDNATTHGICKECAVNIRMPGRGSKNPAYSRRKQQSSLGKVVKSDKKAT